MTRTFTAGLCFLAAGVVVAASDRQDIGKRLSEGSLAIVAGGSDDSKTKDAGLACAYYLLPLSGYVTADACVGQANGTDCFTCEGAASGSYKVPGTHGGPGIGNPPTVFHCQSLTKKLGTCSAGICGYLRDAGKCDDNSDQTIDLYPDQNGGGGSGG